MRTIFIALFFLSVLRFSLAYPYPPDFCKHYDCPLFEVKSKTEDYELRIYQPSTWLCSNSTGVSLAAAAMHGVHHIYEYLHGNNSYNRTLPMTVPIMIGVKPQLIGPSNFSVCYFLPLIWQPNPPEPHPDSHMQIVRKHNPYELFVTGFGGLPTELAIAQNAYRLKTALETAQIEFVGEQYGVAVYDAPWRTQNRHNEIWFCKMHKDLISHSHHHPYVPRFHEPRLSFPQGPSLHRPFHFPFSSIHPNSGSDLSHDQHMQQPANDAPSVSYHFQPNHPPQFIHIPTIHGNQGSSLPATAGAETDVFVQKE
jgi:hypothetical protein